MTELKDIKFDEKFDAFVLLKEVDIRTTSQGKPYLAVEVADRSMEVRGMLWDVDPEAVKELAAGTVVQITAVKQLYQERPQLKLLAIRPAVVGEPQNAADFMQAAPVRAAEMEEEISKLLFQITNATWQRVVRHLLKKFHDDFYKHPAAKANHHAFAGGLAYHSLSIARLAESVVKQYDDVNASLLYAGALLHDLGKVIELSGPVATKYTTAGNLIGHITLIDEQIVIASQEIGLDLYSEDMLVLRHTVLAHHGLLEYGSPVKPLIKEANILHQLDELDATMQSFDNALADTEPGTFSGRQWALDQRSIYRPNFDK